MRGLVLIGLLELAACAAPTPEVAPPVFNTAGEPPGGGVTREQIAAGTAPDPGLLSASPEARSRPRRLFHLPEGGALFCYRPEALLMLSEPDAERRMGSINFHQVAGWGGCYTSYSREVMAVCAAGPRVTAAAPWRGGSCRFMLTSIAAKAEAEYRPAQP